jgi:hypothetical protein
VRAKRFIFATPHRILYFKVCDFAKRLSRLECSPTGILLKTGFDAVSVGQATGRKAPWKSR